MQLNFIPDCSRKTMPSFRLIFQSHGNLGGCLQNGMMVDYKKKNLGDVINLWHVHKIPAIS